MGNTLPWKDPDATKDYGIDWSDWLGSDTISTSTWTVSDDLTTVSSSADTTSATIWLAGGEDGEDYELVNRIVTAGGRTEERTIIVPVRSM